MSKTETTLLLENLTCKLLNPHMDPRIYFAQEVTFNYGSQNECRVDFMKIVPINNSISGVEKSDVYCYELKSSTQDFMSPNGHNFIGDYNYYVMPHEVYDNVKSKIPYNVGVYTLEHGNLYSTKKAKRKDRDIPLTTILLMMFRSSNRELIKLQRQARLV